MRKPITILLLTFIILLVAAPVFADTGDLVLPNPIKCKYVECVLLGILRYFLAALAIIATFMFIYGGFLWLTSGGNEKRVQQGKETLSWAAIGIVVIILSWAMISYLLEALVNTTSRT